MRLAVLILCSVALAGAPEDVSAPRVREAAARAVARLQGSQKKWLDEQSCSSCHHQFLPALAFRDARGQRIPVDEKIAHLNAASAFAVYADLDHALQHAHVVDPGIGDALGLVAADAAGVRPNLATAVYARLLAQRQKPDGHWINFDERPPQSYSVFSATALAARAIDLYSHPSLKADARRRMDLARTWLLSHQATDTESRSFQLLGLLWTGADAASRRDRARELWLGQQADGGWNSLDGRPSDAYSTGEALVALADAGDLVPSDAEHFKAWTRGIEFLLKTQAPDGTWHVASRLYPPAPLSPDYFESGYPYGHDQFLSALGASWAVMAFARTLAPKNAHELNSIRASPVPTLREAEAKNLPAWAERVLFGSLAELQALLDHGFDANSATAAGTTALMMAAPDAEKMQLLLERGAQINARTKNGYSALLMSALYPGSAAARTLLLKRGAELRPAGALFNAYPVALAAIAGDAEAVAQFHAAGDGVDDNYVYAGLQPGSPLLLISTMGEIAVARALLDCGADADKPDTDGLTALQWAALSNQTEMAELLIRHGARVNHVDKHGMTALLYAASIDFGDSAMVDLLLKSGADPAARTKDGLTALDLAKKYKHTHLLGSLSR